MEEQKLIYVRPISLDSGEITEYEFFFSSRPEDVWGEDWNEPCPSAIHNGSLTPTEDMYENILHLRTTLKFTCAQENSCFSLLDMQDKIIACAAEDISEYDEYPEPFRLVFQYGEDYKEVENKLAMRHQFFVENIFEDKKT